VVAIFVGTGIGGAIISNGRLFEGSSGAAGEIGVLLFLGIGFLSANLAVMVTFVMSILLGMNRGMALSRFGTTGLKVTSYTLRLHHSPMPILVARLCAAY